MLDSESSSPADVAHRGRLFIISGPSGAGKGTIVREVLSRLPGTWVAVSATTRPPRPGERDGVEYYFVSDDEFDDLLSNDRLFEWAEVHGNRYGTPRGPVEDRLARGYQVILEIDPQGAFQIRDLIPESVLLFITTPSIEDLQHRLCTRGSETPMQVARRLRTAQRELELVGDYDHVVLNDDVSRASAEVAHIIETYASSKERDL